MKPKTHPDLSGYILGELLGINNQPFVSQLNHPYSPRSEATCGNGQHCKTPAQAAVKESKPSLSLLKIAIACYFLVLKTRTSLNQFQ